ncbi:acyl carrier protein [Paenibacillus sp. y28]
MQESIGVVLNIAPHEVRYDEDLRRGLGADHLDMVEIIMELDREFDILISDEDANKFERVKDIIKYLESTLE